MKCKIWFAYHEILQFNLKKVSEVSESHRSICSVIKIKNRNAFIKFLLWFFCLSLHQYLTLMEEHLHFLPSPKSIMKTDVNTAQWEFGQPTLTPTYLEDKIEVDSLRYTMALFTDFKMFEFWGRFTNSKIIFVAATSSALSHCALLLCKLASQMANNYFLFISHKSFWYNWSFCQASCQVDGDWFVLLAWM